MKGTRLAIGMVKVTAWIVFAFTLFVAGIAMALTSILSSDKLTLLTEKVANKLLDADVEIGNVSVLRGEGSQYLYLDVDDLTICPRNLKALPPAIRDSIPVWGDTLVSLKHFWGGVNIAKLFAGVVELKDISLTHPQINILVVNETFNNFSIVPISTPQDTSANSVPDIRVNKLELLDPAPIRFADLTQKLDVTANIITMSLANESVPNGYFPAYKVDFACDINSPAFDAIGRTTVPMSLNGIAEWHFERPYALVLKDMNFALLMLSGCLNTNVDFSDLMTISTFDMLFNPLQVNDVLSIIPGNIAKSADIPLKVNTDARIEISASLQRPYTVGQIPMPFATVNIAIPDCSLKYEKMDLRRLAADIEAKFVGGTPDDIMVDIKRFIAQGPSSDLSLGGVLSSLVSDPRFEGTLRGNIAISHIPSFITSRIGAVLGGNMWVDARVDLSTSMLNPEKFHNIKLKGNIEGKNLYYLAYDTLSMVAIPKIKGTFGIDAAYNSRYGTVTDSLLRGTIDVDSADILVSGLDIRIGELKLDVASDKSVSIVPYGIRPMAGGISASSFSLFTISDTAGVKVNNLNGDVSMCSSATDKKLPLFKLNLNLGGLSTGDNKTRFIVGPGELKFDISKLRGLNHSGDKRKKSGPKKRYKRAIREEIPVESVYAFAKEIRSRHKRKGPRVHTVNMNDTVEILEWGTTDAFYKFMHNWRWSGALRTGAASLVTPSFPVRNRVKDLDITFSNDSLYINNMQYKAGRSDFIVSGKFSNLKDGFTSETGSVPLKANLKLLSDTIDVNEISNAFFSAAVKKDKSMSRRKDANKPLLIPDNLEAKFEFLANHVTYSDLHLNDFSGEMLLYDGAINLHEFNASSPVGSVNLNALYYAPSLSDMNFGFGLKLNDFNIKNFLKIVPAVDSMMPLMRDLGGIVNANIAASSKLDTKMNLDLPSLKAAIRIEGDSLSFLDPDTFNKIAKWLLFKNKNRNIIDHVTAELTVSDGEMRVYPFIFDFDRYKLGIQGYNDLALNFHYHVAVLKSPLPFKFGVNISGKFDHMKIRFGGARFNEKQAATHVPIVNDMRINLVNQIQNVFRRGVKNSDFSNVLIPPMSLPEKINLDSDTLTPSDSIYLRNEGLIP